MATEKLKIEFEISQKKRHKERKIKEKNISKK